MSDDVHPYLFLGIFLVMAVVFPLLPLSIAWLWRKVFHPNKKAMIKRSTYECGLASQGEVWICIQPDYYLYALLFLIFDVEALFLLPFGVAFLGLGVGAVVAMLIFLLFLAEGLVWAWKKGVLNWR